MTRVEVSLDTFEAEPKLIRCARHEVVEWRDEKAGHLAASFRADRISTSP